MKSFFLFSFLFLFNNLFSQTIATGIISSPKCAGATFNLTYSKSGTFTTGNVFTAQLSNATGSFTNPVNIGTLSSTLAGTIVCSIPTNTPTGSGYRVRVVSSAPVKTGSVNYSNVTINALVTPLVSVSSSSNTSICNSTSVTLTASALNGGTSPIYAWYKNGISVGTNSNVYMASSWNDKDTIYCVLTSNATCKSSNVDTSNFKVMDVENANGKSWRRRANLPDTITDYSGAVGFSIGNKGYMAGSDVFWEFDPSTDTWTIKSDVPGNPRRQAVGFSIGNKGYVGTGGYPDFYEYDPSTDQWTRKADFPGGGVIDAVAFSINGKGYVGSERSFWEYNPINDVWVQKNNFPGTGISGYGLSIGNKGYVGGGFHYGQNYVNGILQNYSVIVFDNLFYEYDPSNDSWSQKASGAPLAEAVAFSVGDKGYVATGWGGYYQSASSSVYEYDPHNNNWTMQPYFEGHSRQMAIGFGIGNKGYIGSGKDDYIRNRYYDFYEPYHDFWEFKKILTIDSLTQSYCPSQSITVTYNVDCAGVNERNVFGMQLSDSSGQFINSQIIGRIASSVSGNISGTIPINIPNSENYHIRLVSYDSLYNPLFFQPDAIFSTAMPISINPVVHPILISGIQNIYSCDTIGNNFSYTINSTPTANYNWSTTGINNSIVSGQGTNAAIFNLYNPGTISVVATVNNACGITSASNTFNFVNTPPTTPTAIKKSFNPDVSADFNITPYLQSSYNLSHVADTFRVRKISFEKSYGWETPVGAVVNHIDDTTIALVFPDNLIITPTSPQFLKVYAQTDCAISAPLIINLYRKFDYPVGSSDITICSGQNVTISASYDTATTMQDADGNIYPITRIGRQVWMAKNLNVRTPYSYYYNDDSLLGNIYGRLYRSYNGAAPNNWHIPTLNEFNEIQNYSADNFNTGGKLKEIGFEYWASPNTGATNEFGFNAIPDAASGGLYGRWWTTSKYYIEIPNHPEAGPIELVYYYMLYNESGDPYIEMTMIGEDMNFSIRCIRNAPALTYLWSNGATTRTINVNPTVNSKYYCTISDGLGYVVDTFKVNVNTAIPAAPLTITGSIDVCPYFSSNNVSAPVRYAVKKVNNANSYNWTVPTGATIISGQGDTAIDVTFSNSFVSGVVSVKSVNGCGNSNSARTLAVYKRTSTTPAAIQKEFSPVSIAAVTNVCGLTTSVYKIKKVNYATSYNWYLNLGTNASITHLNAPGVNDTAVMVTFFNGFNKDTLCVKSLTACNASIAKSIVLNAKILPTTVASISGIKTPCIGETITYNAIASMPTISQTAIRIFHWTKPNYTTILSANADSSVINLKFNTGFTGGNVSVKGESACGIIGSAKTLTLQYLTPTPTSIASSTGAYNACVGVSVNYTAVVPAPTASQRIASVYRWTKPNNSVILNANEDSSSISLQFKTGYIGGSISVKGQTACGITGAAKTQAITHVACNPGTKLDPIFSDKNKDRFNVIISPNPTTTEFSLKVTNADFDKNIEIKIRDVEGRLIKSFFTTSNQNILFGNDLMPGVYMLEISNGINKKIIRAVKY